jgi:hypothetical protein
MPAPETDLGDLFFAPLRPIPRHPLGDGLALFGTHRRSAPAPAQACRCCRPCLHLFESGNEAVQPSFLRPQLTDDRFEVHSQFLIRRVVAPRAPHPLRSRSMAGRFSILWSRRRTVVHNRDRLRRFPPGGFRVCVRARPAGSGAYGRRKIACSVPKQTSQPMGPLLSYLSKLRVFFLSLKFRRGGIYNESGI